MVFEQTHTITNEPISYAIDKKLLKYLKEHVKIDLAKKDKDYPLIIDGYEGAGKSTFAQQIGFVVDPSLTLDRICMTAEEFRQAVYNADKNQCVIYDEAVTGMTAGDSISKVGKLLKSLMMQMRQKNLFIIVILPSIFEFNKYAVLSRAKAFFHIYESKGNRGYFVGFNRRDMRRTYLKGKKNYTYTVKSKFRGRFYGKLVVNEKEYRKKHNDALKLIEEEDEKEGNKYLYQRDLIIKGLYEDYLKSYRKVAEWLKKKGVKLSYQQIGLIVAKQWKTR